MILHKIISFYLLSISFIVFTNQFKTKTKKNIDRFIKFISFKFVSKS